MYAHGQYSQQNMDSIPKWFYLVVDPILLPPCGISIHSVTTFLSLFDQGEVGHKLELNLVPNWDVEVEDNSSLTRIFSPLMSVYCVTIESGSPRMLKVESRRGEVGERLLVGDVHLLFGGVKVSWSPKGDDVATPPNTLGDGERLKKRKFWLLFMHYSTFVKKKSTWEFVFMGVLFLFTWGLHLRRAQWDRPVPSLLYPATQTSQHRHSSLSQRLYNSFHWWRVFSIWIKLSP